MMATKQDIQLFLQDFLEKMKIWEIRFRDDRQKNTRTLFNLELRPADRIKIIEALLIRDYSDGPITDKLNVGAPLWIFGKLVKGQLIYIKISVGAPSRPVICISFHEAAYEMKFPFKESITHD